MLDARVTGQAQLRKLAAHIRAEGDKGLGRDLAKALGDAVEPLKKAIGQSAAVTMPSGYAPTLTRSLRHRRTVRAAARQASVRLATFGAGEKERRDLPALEAGKLRHPVYGRSRRTKKGRKANPWSVTRVRPGFHARGTEKAGDLAEEQALKVLDDFTDRLTKG